MARLGRTRPHPPIVQRFRIVAGSQTVTAQVSTVSLTAVAGTKTTGAATVTAQPATLALSAVAGTVTGTTVLLSDDFPGSTINTANWDVYNRCGDLANSEVNAVIPANVRVAGGSLLIDSKFEDVTIGDSETAPFVNHYTSGQVAERNVSFLYGSVQVRAKIPGGTGTWPCIWMLGHNWQASQPYTANIPGADWPNGGWWEIDIAEFMSGHRTVQNCALHFVTANRGGSGEKSIPFDATSRFMVYRLDWTATSLTWYIDAEDGNGWVQLLQITGTAGTDIPNTPGYLIIHTAIGGVGGTPDSSTFPVTFEVDYARVTLDPTSTVEVLAQPATLALTAVAGSTAGSQSRTAQIASLALTAVQGAVTSGAVAVTAQPAVLALTALAGTKTTGQATTTAQTAALTLTGQPGVLTSGAATLAAQPAGISLSAVPGIASGGGATPQTVTAQIAALTLTAVTGTITTGVVTLTTQPGTLTLTAVSGTVTAGTVTVTSQPALIALSAVPGSMTVGMTVIVAQIAVLTLTAVAYTGQPTRGGTATHAFTAVGAVTHVFTTRGTVSHAFAHRGTATHVFEEPEP